MLFETQIGAVIFACIHLEGKYFKLGENEGAKTFLRVRYPALVLWVVKHLVPFPLNDFFKFKESKNGTQRL